VLVGFAQPFEVRLAADRGLQEDEAGEREDRAGQRREAGPLEPGLLAGEDARPVVLHHPYPLSWK
jgi:hypothetical protein